MNHGLELRNSEFVRKKFFDRYTIIAFTNESGKNVLIGIIWLRPYFLKSADVIRKQYKDIDTEIKKQKDFDQ